MAEFCGGGGMPVGEPVKSFFSSGAGLSFWKKVLSEFEKETLEQIRIFMCPVGTLRHPRKQ
jgi:hypothetical protein